MHEAFPNQFGYNSVMTHRPKKQKTRGRIDRKTFADTGLFAGTSTKAFQIGNGRCNSPSTLHTSTLQRCAANTSKRIVTCTTRFHRSSLTPTPSKPPMTFLKRRKG